MVPDLQTTENPPDLTIFLLFTIFVILGIAKLIYDMMQEKYLSLDREYLRLFMLEREKEEKCHWWEKRYKALEHVHQVKEEECITLKKQCSQVNSLLQNKQESLDALMRQYRELGQLRWSLQQQKEEKEEECITLKKQCSQMNSLLQLKEMVIEKSIAVSHYINLQSLLQEKEEECEASQEQCEEYETYVESLTTINKEQKIRIAQLTNTITQLKHNTTTLRKRVYQMEQTQEGLKEQIAIAYIMQEKSDYAILLHESEKQGEASDDGRIQSIGELLECPICVENFIQPTTLHCGHSYCKKCVERCMDSAHKCPECRSHVDLPLPKESILLKSIAEILGSH